MDIIVAGAGAGKTSSMARMVLDRYKVSRMEKLFMLLHILMRRK